jgi:hypothetical protein
MAMLLKGVLQNIQYKDAKNDFLEKLTALKTD